MKDNSKILITLVVSAFPDVEHAEAHKLFLNYLKISGETVRQMIASPKKFFDYVQSKKGTVKKGVSKDEGKGNLELFGDEFSRYATWRSLAIGQSVVIKKMAAELEALRAGELVQEIALLQYEIVSLRERVSQKPKISQPQETPQKQQEHLLTQAVKKYHRKAEKYLHELQVQLSTVYALREKMRELMGDESAFSFFESIQERCNAKEYPRIELKLPNNS